MFEVGKISYAYDLLFIIFLKVSYAEEHVFNARVPVAQW